MDEIKITATTSDDDTMCTFTVDRPVYAGGSWYFGSKDAARGSPLVEKLFEIEGIDSVLVADNIVKVTKSSWDEWLPIAKQIGATIREHLKSGQPAVNEELKKNLPPEPVIAGKVQELLDLQINPAVAGHGGFVELIDVKGNTVYLRMAGGCQGCGRANVTLRQGIERLIRQHIPEVGEILDTTDHAAGRNPYYQPAK